MRGAGLLAALLPLGPALTGEGPMPLMTVQDLLALPQPPADHRLAYGEDSQQFGELRLPQGEGPFPVAVLVHGGCWLAPYDLKHLSSLAAALTGQGLATWSLEYRRLGQAGGGFPGTFQDVAQGVDFLRLLADRFPLDLGRVVFVGHSAGGHLAMWLAGRPRLPAESPLRQGEPLRPRGVVALAGIPDLAVAAELNVCGTAVRQLLGGHPAEVPERLAVTSPVALLPLAVPVALVTGAEDQVVPAVLAEAFVSQLARAGDPHAWRTIPGAGHYELVNPASRAWPVVLEAVLRLAGSGGIAAAAGREGLE